ncbi:low-specificity L-threonine aldolase [Malassezia yamatoensis]|uniref:Low-specificity L-threonine aldolase n=1 Tax=Malassezia yamatoensis TaxID=253288 RepID=A0AAJ5YQC7_9BASI|nr:low-specificity L-threonine aldolase [Malassezia yamatoensis]
MVYASARLADLHTAGRAANGMLRRSRVQLAPYKAEAIIPPWKLPTAEEDRIAYRNVGYNLYSDTVTLPTEPMRQAMARAVCADEVYEHHTPTIEFQQMIADLTGKEAALFMPSGTLSNQLALHLHLLRVGGPASVVCDDRTHVYQNESGGLSYHSRAAAQTIMPSNGHHLTLEEVQKRAILSEDQHYAPTRVISLENTLSGTIFPQDEIVKISEWAHEHSLKMHLDGARLWNVAAETGDSIKELCAPFDTVSLCLSKGLGAPVGSILVGPKEMMERARKFRKLFGSGMRQIGGLVAAAHLSVHDTFPQLRRSHDLAHRCAEMLASRDIPLTVPCETSMVCFDAAAAGYDAAELEIRAAKLEPPIILSYPRLVFHYQVHEDVVERLAALLDEMKSERR